MPRSRARPPSEWLLVACLAIDAAGATDMPVPAPVVPATATQPARPAPMSAVKLRKAIARAERQLRATGSLLQRLMAAPAAQAGTLDPTLRNEYYGSYHAALRAHNALRAEAALFMAEAAITSDAALATSGATAACADAFVQLRAIRDALVRNEPPATRLAASDAAVENAVRALAGAATTLGASAALAAD